MSVWRGVAAVGACAAAAGGDLQGAGGGPSAAGDLPVRLLSAHVANLAAVVGPRGPRIEMIVRIVVARSTNRRTSLPGHSRCSGNRTSALIIHSV